MSEDEEALANEGDAAEQGWDGRVGMGRRDFTHLQKHLALRQQRAQHRAEHADPARGPEERAPADGHGGDEL